MMEHILRGKDGEQLAEKYLIKKDFEILFRNWRHRQFEVDIIAAKEKTVHFIEVKTRHSLTFGYPEESVTKKKFNSLKNAAMAFSVMYPKTKNIQFDIVSILILPGRAIEYFFIEDVYL